MTIIMASYPFPVHIKPGANGDWDCFMDVDGDLELYDQVFTEDVLDMIAGDVQLNLLG